MYNDLFGLLITYICDESYIDGVKSLRNDIAASSELRQHWYRLAEAIKNRTFLPGQSLNLVHHGANKMLEENTDDEAYRWLDVFVENIDRTDGCIDPY